MSDRPRSHERRISRRSFLGGTLAATLAAAAAAALPRARRESSTMPASKPALPIWIGHM